MIDDFDSNHPHVASPESTNTFDALRLVKTSVGAARRLAFLAYSQRDTEIEKKTKTTGCKSELSGKTVESVKNMHLLNHTRC